MNKDYHLALLVRLANYLLLMLAVVTTSFHAIAKQADNSSKQQQNAEFIAQHYRADPCKVAQSIKYYSATRLNALSVETLAQAGYAAARCIDAKLTMKLAELLAEKSVASGSEEYQGLAEFNKGILNYRQGNYNYSLSAFLLALNYFEKAAHPRNIVQVNNALAELSTELGVYALAEINFVETTPLTEMIADKFVMAEILLKHSMLNIKTDKLKQAENKLIRAKTLIEKMVPKNQLLQLELDTNLAKLFLKRNDLKNALEHLQLAAVSATQLQLRDYQSEINRMYSNYYLTNQLSHNLGEEHFNQAQTIAESNMLLGHLRKNLLLRKTLEIQTGNYKAVHNINQKIHVIEKQISFDDTICQLKGIGNYYVTVETENSRLLLEKENQIAALDAQKNKILRNFLIFIAVVAVFLAVYFIRRSMLVNKQAAIYEKQSKVDPLTGVWNRRAAEAHLERLCHRDPEKIKVFSIAMLDIDHFKSVNDRFGHDVGDKVIVAVCRIIQDSLRPMDMLCRWGGEEFVLILENFDSDMAYEICERIRQKIKKSTIENVDKMTVSIGISMYQNDDLFELIKRGDQALYKAKDLGRDMVIIKNK